MSYEIWASGTAREKKFSYPSKKIADPEEIIEAAEIFDLLSKKTRLGGLNSFTTKLLGRTGKETFIHYARLQVMSLREKNISELWLDVNSSGKFFGLWEKSYYEKGFVDLVYAKDGEEALKELLRVMKSLEIDKWGILRELCIVFQRYMDHCERYGKSKMAILRIVIYK